MVRDLLGVQRERRALDRETGRAFTPTTESDVTLDVDEETGGESSKASRLKTEASSWVDNVKNTIPVEIVTAWAAIDSMATIGSVSDRVHWLLFGVFCVATLAHMWVEIETPTRSMAERLGVPYGFLKQSQYAKLLLAVGGFVVWAYYLKGPFAYGLPGLFGQYNQTHAAILLPLYVVLGPQLVPNVLRKLHGVDVRDDQQRPPNEFATGGDEQEDAPADASES